MEEVELVEPERPDTEHGTEPDHDEDIQQLIQETSREADLLKSLSQKAMLPQQPDQSEDRPGEERAQASFPALPDRIPGLSSLVTPEKQKAIKNYLQSMAQDPEIQKEVLNLSQHPEKLSHYQWWAMGFFIISLLISFFKKPKEGLFQRLISKIRFFIIYVLVNLGIFYYFFPALSVAIKNFIVARGF